MNQLPATVVKLTIKESAIIDLLKQGLSRKQIAYELNMKYGTLDSHFKHIFLKLDTHSMTETVLWAIKNQV